PARGPDRAGQVPGSVERLAPAARGADRLTARGDTVEQHPDGPDQLEGLTSFAPLVEQCQGEHESQGGGGSGQPCRGHVRPRAGRWRWCDPPARGSREGAEVARWPPAADSATRGG